ncbi:GNAT family N-acetyltransferase [Kribbella sp. NBC_01484]|uniref:GNAT family N-acetyltransferase n=1 Tax=Kribbella sp. NBC_01484 TaxID=2903579 RepID=UPI002E342A09|nr:GNAT family N-acetyltransferase [Kribbella sp. NBC_01484]
MLIEERHPTDRQLAVLLDAAFGELVNRYGAEGRSPVHGDARFLVVGMEGRAVGCGALQPSGDSSIGELKRMYVAPAFRGRGIGGAVLTGLEKLAADIGYLRIRLATGVRQPEAIALYERRGYRLIEPYGKYVDDTLARCYQKTLVI